MADRDNAYAEQSKLLDSKYDNLFRAIVSGEWCVKSDGNVEAPSGYFSLTEIPDNVHELSDMRDAIVDALDHTEFRDIAAWPSAGWYVTMELNTGVIYIIEYPSRSAAEKTYQELNENFTNWATTDELP